MTTLIKDPQTGTFVAAPPASNSGRAIVDLTGPAAPANAGDSYATFIANITGMLQDAVGRNATNTQALMGQRNALETQSVAGPQGAQSADPTIWSQDQDKIRQGWAATYAPAVTSLTDQMNANTANLGAITDLAKTQQDFFKPTPISPGQSLVTPAGKVVIQGTEYSVVPDPTNPGQYKAIPTNSLGAPGSAGNPAADALTAYNGGTDPDYSSKVLGIKKTIDSLGTINADTLDGYIAGHARSAPITGQMLMQAATHYGLDPSGLAAQLALESNFGTTGESPKNNNPGGIKWVHQANAVQGSEVPHSEGGGYYAKFKSPLDGLYAMADLMAKKAGGGASPEAPAGPTYAMNTQAQTYADDVTSGRRGYTDAVAAMALYGAVGKPALDGAIRAKNPAFNFAQADTLASQQGSIGPAYTFAKTALTNVQDVMKKLGTFQGTNVPGLNTVGNIFSLQTGAGSLNTRQFIGAVQEARNAYAQLLAASKGGTPTDYGVQAKTAIPDNPTPNDIAAALANLDSLGGAKVNIYGNPGGNSNAPAASGSSYKGFVLPHK